MCPLPHSFPVTTQQGRSYSSLFTDEETEAQKVKETCPRPPSQYVSDEDGCPDPSACLLVVQDVVPVLEGLSKSQDS